MILCSRKSLQCATLKECEAGNAKVYPEASPDEFCLAHLRVRRNCRPLVSPPHIYRPQDNGWTCNSLGPATPGEITYCSFTHPALLQSLLRSCAHAVLTAASSETSSALSIWRMLTVCWQAGRSRSLCCLRHLGEGWSTGV